MQSPRDALILSALAVAVLAYLAAGSGKLASGPGLIAMLPFVRRATLAIRPPRFPWPAAPLAHLPIAMLLAIVQLAVTLAVCKLLALDPPALLPEVRRALIVYAAAAAALLIAGRRVQA